MVARVWHGYTTAANADAYEAMLKPELLPGLSTKKGFRGSYLLRRMHGDEVEFITIILWDKLDDIRALTGPDYETAVIPDARKQVLSHWDEKAAHYDVTSTQASPLSFLAESR
jgi:heme-degrading monooxygenase HmoA